MLSIYICRFYFEKWDYGLKTIYKSPLFVYNSSAETWLTLACPVLQLFFFLLVCSICSNRKMKFTSHCLNIWMSLGKVGNNSWYSQRICFCRFGTYGSKFRVPLKAVFNMLCMIPWLGGRLMCIALSSMSRKMWRQ